MITQFQCTSEKTEGLKESYVYVSRIEGTECGESDLSATYRRDVLGWTGYPGHFCGQKKKGCDVKNNYNSTIAMSLKSLMVTKLVVYFLPMLSGVS